MADEAWSSEEQGWIVCIKSRPEGIEALPPGRQPGTQGAVAREYFAKIINELRARLPEGVGMPVCWLSIGGVCIVGPEEACSQLKAELEVDGGFSMTKNRRLRLIFGSAC